MRWRILTGGLGATLAILGAPGAGGATAVPRPVAVRASPSVVVSGHRVVISGRAPAGSVVRLSGRPYPYRTASPVQTAVAAVNGSFRFAVFPDRDTRYLVKATGMRVPAAVQVRVTGRTLTRVRALSLGRVRVTVVVFHPADLRWGDAPTSWWFAGGPRGGFAPAPRTRSIKLSRHVVVLSTVVALPAGRFRWRACFRARGDHALENPRRPPGCRGRGYRGAGRLPIGFPGPGALARAERALVGRDGRTALAVIDSEGRLSGLNLHETFITGSVVKAMLLVAYLRRLDALGQHHVDPGSNAFLYPMIHVSDNTAASQCWSIVGNASLYALAAAAGMSNFSITTDWGSARFSAADQARFFFRMDSLIPPEFVGYARRLLSTIASYESWGIPEVARPLGYTVFFKGGWRPSPDVYLVHQIARLEGHRHTFAMAVMTDGDPDMGYGIDTIQDVIRALLG